LILRFAGFDLDFHRSELRSAAGEPIKLRPKTFALLHLLATNANRLLSKQEMMAAVWPNVHVGDDSLFQCIREIRTALGDEDRQLVKSVSGRGYMLDADVKPVDREDVAAPDLAPSDDAGADAARPPQSAAWRRPRFALHPLLLVALAVCCVVGAAIAAPILARRLSAPAVTTIAVMPIEARSSDPDSTAMAASITDGLTDGLSKIGNIHVLSPQSVQGLREAAADTPKPDFVLRGDLQRVSGKWDIQARLIDGKSGQVTWSGAYSAAADNPDQAQQQTRLIAGIGYPLALQINTLTYTRLSSADSKIVIKEASAFINRTTRERFAAAQAMLEKALTAHPNDVGLESALAAHLLRGIQTVWYTPEEAKQSEQRARALLEGVLRKEPNYIPGLQSYCRFLVTTNHFSDSLVACEKALSFEPWDGSVLFQVGLSQLQLGRFEDALATFIRADSYNTPQVSRWTWLLGAGLTLVLLHREDEALTWLERSLAITPGTGRTHMMLAAAYEALGRHEEAKAAVAQGLQLRPGTTARNVGLPTQNQSPRYLAEASRVVALLIAAGLPER
jgi:DNA-binding winged helix-turn-helix (wHTH) protein/TolB-like protein/Flp pilus assembly protein TadD